MVEYMICLMNELYTSSVFESTSNILFYKIENILIYFSK